MNNTAPSSTSAASVTSSQQPVVSGEAELSKSATAANSRTAAQVSGIRGKSTGLQESLKSLSAQVKLKMDEVKRKNKIIYNQNDGRCGRFENRRRQRC
jgi:subtilisin family serine protease